MATRGAPERNGTFLGYSFVPLPRRARRANGEGRLSDERLALVALLYDEADIGRLKRRLPTPTLTREQIAAGVGGARHIDSVLRLLRRLRDDPGQWFTYRIERGRYVFTLNPDDPSAILSAPESTDLSEVAMQPDPAPALASQGTADTDLSALAYTHLSAYLSASDTDLSANPGPATPHQHGDPGPPPERPVRVPQSFREHQPSHRTMGGDTRTRTREDDDLASFLPDVSAAILRHRRNVAAGTYTPPVPAKREPPEPHPPHDPSDTHDPPGQAHDPPDTLGDTDLIIALGRRHSFIDLLKADLDDDDPGNTENHPGRHSANGSDVGSSVVGAGSAPRARARATT